MCVKKRKGERERWKKKRSERRNEMRKSCASKERSKRGWRKKINVTVTRNRT